MKLVKRSNGRYDLYSHEDIDQLDTLASSFDNPKGKLSLKNCEAIENGYDLDELVNKLNTPEGYDQYQYDSGVRKGFELALQILGDKKFTKEDMINAVLYGTQKGLDLGKVPETDNDWVRNYIKSLQQTEWDVEIEMAVSLKEKWIGGGKGYGEYEIVPKLDADGCLILKRK